MEQQVPHRIMHMVHLLGNVQFQRGKVTISAASPPCQFLPSGLRIWYLFESRVIQQVFSATDSSRKRWNKYFIFNLLKSNVVCKRVLEGAQSCWSQICDSKVDFFDWFDLAFERRGTQRKLWAPVLHIWPKFTLQKYFRGFCLGSEIFFRVYIFWYISALAICSVWFMESLQRQFYEALRLEVPWRKKACREL